LKIFAVTEYLPAGAGFKVTIVKASSLEEAFTKYTSHTNYKCNINLDVKEVVGEVCEIVTFNNPHYEG
jgi:hypothetical protein